MQRGLGGGTVFEPAQEPIRRDRELTLGPATLGAIGIVLFALCAGCFLFGYSVGHRAAESGTAVPTPAVDTPLSPQAGLQSKPSARPAVVAPPLTSTLPDQPEIADANSSAPPAAVSVPVSSIPGSADAGPAGPVVHAAVTSQPAAAPSASGAARVEPALAQLPASWSRSRPSRTLKMPMSWWALCASVVTPSRRAAIPPMACCTSR